MLFENISLNLANILEEELIKKYKTMDNKIGYNMIAGGNNRKRRQEVTDRIAEKNRNPSPETLKKMSIASTGRKHSQETIEKIRKSNIGQKRSDEARKKMSIAKQNISDETRRKISEAGMGRKPSKKSIEINRARFIGNKLKAIPVCQYTKNGEFLKLWECAMDVEKELGIDHGNIGKCCSGNAKTAGGFQWKHYNGETKDIEPASIISINKRIMQFEKNGEYIKTWNSLYEISKTLNFHNSNISKCCQGKIKTAYGYIWKYADK